jgi:dihydroorotate dehydrogenase (fumarate)
MADLKTTYMGIPLQNPLIAGASSHTGDIGSLQKLQEAGAGAVVLKSLFEEQIQLERFEFDEDRDRYENISPEISSPLYPRTLEHSGPEGHLLWVGEVRKNITIPVIASINAVSSETWVDYARKLENTGVDALELNVYTVPQNTETGSEAVENEQAASIAAVCRSVSIPVAVKITPYYTNPLNFISRLTKEGVRGVVIFNRLLQPSVDPIHETIFTPAILSAHQDLHLPLRFTGLLYGNAQTDICTSTGITSGADMAAALLTGASAVQVVTALYRNGIGHIRTILNDLQTWMDSKGYTTINQFRGKTSSKEIKDPWAYTRAQYITNLFRANRIMGITE